MIPYLRSLLLSSAICTITAAATRFQSVSLSYYVRDLYEEIASEEDPHCHDPVVLDPGQRQQICEDITNNGMFLKTGLNPCSAAEWYRDRIYRTYYQHFLRGYSRRQFRLMEPPSPIFIEHLFVCLVKHGPDHTIVPFYVSKEYNVAPAVYPSGYKPGRFVFGNFNPANGYFHPDYYVMLAEESARNYFPPAFNIELHYLTTRKYTKPVEHRVAHVDPLCGLVSADRFDYRVQYSRICMAVCTSSVDRFALDDIYHPCARHQVSFRTPQGVRASDGEWYYEHMTLCRCAHVFSIIGTREVYVSRSYRTDQVLTYQFDSLTERMYLRNLITNISVVDELNSFDFVED